jgi:hypothetical protein
MAFTKDTQPEITLRFPHMTTDRVLSRIQQTDEGLYKEITSKLWHVFPQALVERIETWKAKEAQRIKADVDQLNKNWMDEQAAVVNQNKQRREREAQRDADHAAGMARLAQYVRERKLLDNPHNAKAIADYIQDHNLQFSEASVDATVVALQSKLQWSII